MKESLVIILTISEQILQHYHDQKLKSEANGD